MIVIKTSPLPWSEIYSTKDINDYTLGCDIIISTTQLSQFSLEVTYDYTEKLMYQVSQTWNSHEFISEMGSPCFAIPKAKWSENQS